MWLLDRQLAGFGTWGSGSTGGGNESSDREGGGEESSPQAFAGGLSAQPDFDDEARGPCACGS